MLSGYVAKHFGAKGTAKPIYHIMLYVCLL